MTAVTPAAKIPVRYHQLENQMQNKIPEFVLEAAKQGVGPQIDFDEDTGLVYRFYTGMKSDLDVVQVAGNWVGLGRYANHYNINSWNDLVDAVKNCRHGRDYMTEKWAKVLDKY